MNLPEKKIIKSENLYKNTGKVKPALALISRYWYGYRLSGDSGFLTKANLIASEALERNKSCGELFLCQIFLSIHTGRHEKAERMLNQISAYKNYYKNNNAGCYAVIFYLRSLLSLKTEKARAALKNFNALREYADNWDNPLGFLLLGSLKVEMMHYEEALPLLEKSYEKGSRDVLLYLCLRDVFEQKIPHDKKALMQKYIGWAITQNISLENILTYYESDDENFFSGGFVAEKVYEAYPSEWVLKNICRNLFIREDYSLRAYMYYREAEKKQIHLDGLNIHLIKAAHKNGIESVSRYSLNLFLQENDMDLNLRGFIYHLMLTNRKFREIAEANEKNIVQFALYCIEHKMTGRYANSVYKYLLEASEIYEIPKEYTDAAEDILWSEMFLFDISSDNPEIKNIWISEKEKRAMVSCKLSGGRATVKAVGEFFSYICFDEAVRKIIDEKLKVVKHIENADTELYQYFYKNGKTCGELLLALSKHFVAMEKPPAGCVDILREAAALTDISHGFKIQINAVLGNIYYSQNMHKEALAYYKDVDENYLNDKYIEQMLSVYINTKEFEKAATLISKKSHCISDRALFYSLKRISSVEEYRPLIADTAYELILKSWYDKTLLDVVTNFYKGSQEEWQELSKALAAISVSELNLDEIILKNSVWMHKFDVGSQKVYVRMYENSPDNDLIGLFTYYCIYEIILCGSKPEYDAIMTLEKIFDVCNDHLLAYALSYVYIENGMSTLKSSEIIEKAVLFMERDGILLPVFKNSKDKKYAHPYIEKNQPFIYRCAPDKSVYLHYRVEGEAEYKSMKMEYFRFGLYLAKIPHFYGERIQYYFSEERATGSIVTREHSVENNRIYINEGDDPFFIINNALIYEQMFKYEKVEEVITDSLRELKNVRGKIL